MIDTTKACVAGIDIGSAFSKAVILSDERELEYHIMPSLGNYRHLAENVLRAALEKTDLPNEQIRCVVTTGYGARKVSFADRTVSDITCNGKGISSMFPSVRTGIDIGAQFTRVFRVDDKGRVSNFLLSDKCAAGSGKLLQIIARVLMIDLEDIGPLSLKSKKKVDFNTGCAVFAESEVISRIAEGAAVEDILAGIHRSLAGKIESMIMRLGMERDLAVSGGGGKDIGLIQNIEAKTGCKIFTPEEPQILTALGAAQIALEIATKEFINKNFLREDKEWQ